MFFSKYETYFANKFLNKLKKNKAKLPKSYNELGVYIASVTWRILYDDLYILDSFAGKQERDFFEDFEKKLLYYLNQIRLGKSPSFPKYIKNYILSIRDFKIKDEIIRFFEPSVFGYSFFSIDRSKYIVFSYYAGIVIATVYRPKNIISMDKGPIKYFIDRYTSRTVKELLKEELFFQLNKMGKQKLINDKILDEGLKNKIINRYKNSKRIKKDK